MKETAAQKARRYAEHRKARRQQLEAFEIKQLNRQARGKRQEVAR